MGMTKVSVGEHDFWLRRTSSGLTAFYTRDEYLQQLVRLMSADKPEHASIIYDDTYDTLLIAHVDDYFFFGINPDGTVSVLTREVVE